MGQRTAGGVHGYSAIVFTASILYTSNVAEPDPPRVVGRTLVAMQFILDNYYYLVTVFTASYGLAFLYFLAPRLSLSKPSRDFGIFLIAVFAWSVKDSLGTVLGHALPVAALPTALVAISPLFLFLPNFSLQMLMSVYNAAVAPAKAFRHMRVAHWLLAITSTLILVGGLIDPGFVYASFVKTQYDYTCTPGPGFWFFMAMVAVSALVPSVLLLGASLRRPKSEAFFVGLGGVLALATVFSTNILPRFVGNPDVPRLGCLSISVLCALTFVGIRWFGAIFSIAQVFAERDRWRNVGLSLKSLTDSTSENALFQSICDFANQITESLFVAVLVFSGDGKRYTVRAVSRFPLSTRDRLARLPLEVGRTYPISEAFALHKQIAANAPFECTSLSELLPCESQSLTLKQILSHPIVYERGVKGVIVYFRESRSDNNDMFGVFSAQCSLVLRFSSQILELQEKRQLEEQLRHAQKMEAVGLLAGGIAHDFNNLLSGISGFAGLIKRKMCENNPLLLKYVEPIIEASQRGADLTGQLLAFARKGKYQQVSVDAHEVIDNVVRLLSRTIDKRIQIDRDLRAKLSTIMGDPSQLENAVLNMALNSRDAMPEGGTLSFVTDNVTILDDAPQTRLYRVQPGEYLELRVVDTGIGMNEETKARMFEPFFTTKKPGKGTGLGLAAVYGCVKSHNGYVEAESSPGKGTAMKILVPVTHQEKAEDPRAIEEVKVIRGKGHVLVVDDEKVVRDVSQEILEELGYSVSLCEDGEQAVAFFRAHHKEIDVTVLDMIMPKMGGYDCFKQFRAIQPGAKVIIATGYSTSDDTQRIVTRGVSAFIQKPFDAEELSQVIAGAIKRAGPA